MTPAAVSTWARSARRMNSTASPYPPPSRPSVRSTSAATSGGHGQLLLLQVALHLHDAGDGRVAAVARHVNGELGPDRQRERAAELRRCRRTARSRTGGRWSGGSCPGCPAATRCSQNELFTSSAANGGVVLVGQPQGDERPVPQRRDRWLAISSARRSVQAASSIDASALRRGARRAGWSSASRASSAAPSVWPR